MFRTAVPKASIYIDGNLHGTEEDIYTMARQERQWSVNPEAETTPV